MTTSKSTRRPKASVSEAPPEAAVEPAQGPSQTKLDRVVALLRRTEGATIEELQTATGWQPHSVRGALAGAVKKRLALPLVSTKEDRGRVYRITSEPQA